MHARALTVSGVAARVDDEPVQPRRELRFTTELAEPDAELREGLLRRVARVFGIAQQMARQPLDARRMAGAQRLERSRVAALRARDENRVTEICVVEPLRRAQRLADSPHGSRSLRPRVAGPEP